MRRLARCAAVTAFVVGVAALLAAGAVRLDARYRATRFALPAYACPLAIVRGEATPMCRPTGPGW